MPDGHAKQLIVARNTRHVTIKRLESAVGHTGLINNLSESAIERHRMPMAQHINDLAGELEGTEPLELLIAYARDAGVRIPGHVGDAYLVTVPLGRLTRDERAALVEILTILSQQFARGRAARRRPRR